MAAASAQGINPGDNVEGTGVPVFDIDIGVNPNVAALEDEAALAHRCCARNA